MDIVMITVLGFLAFAAIIVTLVFGILYLVSNLAGWAALARQYEVDEGTFKGAMLEEVRPWIVRVGADQYKNLVKIICYERGVELKNSLPYLKPLFFPWDDIKNYRPARMIMLTGIPHEFYVNERRILFSSKIVTLETRLSGNHTNLA